jgi:hypothetical protein
LQDYHKIQSMFKRDMTKNGKMLLGEWTLPEFEYLKDNKWIFTEKVDGTNIRVSFDGEKITYGGRHENSQIPSELVNRLKDIFDSKIELFKEKFAGEKIEVDLYGEGYGAGIQKVGVSYGKTKEFVLFDVLIGGFWLSRENVEDIAGFFQLDVVPVIGEGTLADAQKLVEDGFNSKWGEFFAEGIVARPLTELLTKRGGRIITKIKHRDYFNK